MEDLNGIRRNFKRSKSLNRQFQSPVQKASIVEYKALLNGIEVKYLPKKDVKNTSKTCHRCGHVAQLKGREFKCPRCGLIYNRLKCMHKYSPCLNERYGMGRSTPRTSI